VSAGIRVTTLEGIALAREGRRSLVCPSVYCWRTPRPAAVILNLSGEIILRLLREGLYLYEKPSPPEKKGGVCPSCHP
jgi:hypothetical protein